MEVLVNLANSPQQKQWFNENEQEVEAFLNQHKLSGIELIFYGNHQTNPFPLKRIKGLHLNYWPTWLDFWREDKAELLRQFGSRENIEQYYGGLQPKVMIDHYRREVQKARELRIEYLVFHVSHVQMEHIYSHAFTYSDWEIMEATSQLINQVFQGITTGPLLLFENLWWPGLNFLNQELTARFFNSINYPHKGFMLDTGHLMLTNPQLKGAKDACKYILEKVEQLGEMKQHIKGIHLNKSSLGSYVCNGQSQQMKEGQSMDLWENYMEIGKNILRMDSHLPFNDPRIKKVIDAINPEYLVFELRASSLTKLGKLLAVQNRALYR